MLALVLVESAACKPNDAGAKTRYPKLPFGALDAPAQDATIKGVAFAIGWGLAEDGLDHVEIYLDRTYLQDAVVKGKREDVIKLFPEFSGVEDVRFITELHTENLPVGRHEISARLVSRNGATRDLVPSIFNIEH